MLNKMRFDYFFNIIIFLGYIFLFLNFWGYGLGWMSNGLFFICKCKNLFFNNIYNFL